MIKSWTGIIDTMTTDELSDLEQSPYPSMLKIEEKVKELQAVHAAGVFDKWCEQDVITCQPFYKQPPNISPTTTITTIAKSLYSAEDGKLNDYERQVIWELLTLPNIKWWHRNISRRGFMINGNIHAYPNLIVMTTTGRLLMVETKGDYLDNDKSKAKSIAGV